MKANQVMCKLFLLPVLFLLVIINPLHSQWVQTNKPSAGTIRVFLTKDTKLFAGTFGGGLFVSVDNGTTWTEKNNGLTSANVFALAANGTDLYAGTGAGIFRSVDNGEHWVPMNNGLTNTFVVTIVINGTNIFAGTNGGGVFLSTDNAANWSSLNNGLTNSFVHTLFLNGTALYAGTDGGGLFVHDLQTTNWTALNNGLPAGPFVVSIEGNSSDLFVGLDNGQVYHSVNAGANWIESDNGISGSIINGLALSGTSLLTATSAGGVFLSVNNGGNWVAVNDGLTNTNIHLLFISGTTVYVVTSAGDVWKRPLSEVLTVTGLEVLNDDNAAGFMLYQNYPNPSNGVTSIPFKLPVKSFVSLKVYDVSGVQVATLVEEVLLPGTYKFQWNTTGRMSGIYFYRLRAGSFTQTKSMLFRSIFN